MAEQPHSQSGSKPPQTPDQIGMKVELAVNELAEAFVFHNKPFVENLGWLEFDLDNNRLDFIMESGSIQNFGIPVRPELAKYMQNAFQVFMIYMDEGTGEPVAGGYFPLMIHRK